MGMIATSDTISREKKMGGGSNARLGEGGGELPLPVISQVIE